MGTKRSEIWGKKKLDFGRSKKTYWRGNERESGVGLGTKSGNVLNRENLPGPLRGAGAKKEFYIFATQKRREIINTIKLLFPFMGGTTLLRSLRRKNQGNGAGK